MPTTNTCVMAPCVQRMEGTRPSPTRRSMNEMPGLRFSWCTINSVLWIILLKADGQDRKGRSTFSELAKNRSSLI